MSGLVKHWPSGPLGWISRPPDEVSVAIELAVDAYDFAATYTTGGNTPPLDFVWVTPAGMPAYTTGSRVVLNISFLVEVLRKCNWSKTLARSIFLFVVSHELGHVAYGDHLNPNADRWQLELRADYVSGSVARAAGVTPQQAVVYLRFLHAVSGGGTVTHPPGDNRVNAVVAGYNQN